MEENHSSHAIFGIRADLHGIIWGSGEISSMLVSDLGYVTLA